MGYEIIKVARDVDLYMEWSSIVEAPTAIGTRAEMLDYLKPAAHDCPSCRCNTSAERLDRADQTGTSGIDYGHGWDSTGLIYEQRGILPRARFEAFARRVHADVPGDDAELLALLDPFEDD